MGFFSEQTVSFYGNDISAIYVLHLVELVAMIVLSWQRILRKWSVISWLA